MSGSKASDASTAAALKDQGNVKYQSQQYKEAVDLYSHAIELDPNNAALYSNRSVSRLLLGKHKEALADAKKCCELKPGWEKGHYRQGAALEAMGDLAAALPAYEAALTLNPMSQESISKVRELKKKVKPQQQQARQSRNEAASKQPWVNIGQPQRVPAGGAGPPGPAAWAQGLKPDQQAEWLVDCYRMRLDDDYAWGGCNLHGLYDPDATKDTIAEDFLVFCKLAVKHKAIPPGWSWDKLLTKAAELLPYAFEKSDAKEKWGGENIFSALMGGRSLRYMGEVVYGCSMTASVGMSRESDDSAALEELNEKVLGQWRTLVSGAGSELFEDVGGVQAWKKLHSKLHVQKFC